MDDEKTTRKLLMSVIEWNDRRTNAYDDLVNFHENYIIITCPECESVVEDQKHVDTSISPWRRQVVCTECKYVGYRFE